MRKYQLVLSMLAGLGAFSQASPVLIPLTENWLSAARASDLTTLVVTTPKGGEYRLDPGSTVLPRATIRTQTAWTKGVQEFSGVPLRELLKAAGLDEAAIRAAKLKARALNDYEVEIPGQDALDYDVLVADSMNGEAMPVSKFGPFWIVYPRDDKPELQDSRFDHRWAWQLVNLKVE